MIGVLFDDFCVELDDHIAGLGGSWQDVLPDGRLAAFDQPLLKFFYERMLEYKEPFVLDIGASTGSFCLLAKYHTGATAWACEPYPVAWQILQSNVRLNGLDDRVATLCCGLSDWGGVELLRVPEKRLDAGLATLGEPRRFSKWADIQVEMFTLDSLAFLHVDLIKIDTEGCELFVLRGGKKTIQRDLPGILLEYDSKNTVQFGYQPEDLVALLRSWGYEKFESIGGADLWASW